MKRPFGLLLAPAALVAVAAQQPQQLELAFNASARLHTISPTTFLGVNLDTASLYYGFDLSEPKLVTLTKALAPAVLRVGGTAADALYYVVNATTPGDGRGNITMSNDLWDRIVAFAGVTGMHLLFDLNALAFRRANGSGWDAAANATALFAYTQAAHPGVRISWSAGNECNLWRKPAGATELARIANQLRAAVSPFDIGADVYGPSYAEFPTESSTYMAATRGNVTGMTWHHYPYAHDCSLHAFLNLGPIASMGRSLRGMASDRAKHADPSLLLVLEEIGGAYGGGCENLTDRFVSGMWWLDTLATAAESGFDRVSRCERRQQLASH